MWQERCESLVDELQREIDDFERDYSIEANIMAPEDLQRMSARLQDVSRQLFAPIPKGEKDPDAVYEHRYNVIAKTAAVTIRAKIQGLREFLQANRVMLFNANRSVETSFREFEAVAERMRILSKQIYNKRVDELYQALVSMMKRIPRTNAYDRYNALNELRRVIAADTETVHILIRNEEQRRLRRRSEQEIERGKRARRRDSPKV